ncbi:methionyl-tRNA formyltransferase [Aquibacillus salsiterrae]|uniref:Methionyl-tRNA formyltransferase n=1 Tax=Aquibacillus salsiterrae TaxID=2950439 RepID=A0A9X3WCL9_9BACI|nr:methionyl-tRNA formyltransferase [Aquibacillus salsiterrae]MDC3416443.1 methionyl-tRNA formyltransferase [Aquibacillus salsiterrae]
MKRIVFMGTPDFAVPVLERLVEENYEVVLVVTQPDRPKGRKRELTPPPVKVAAKKHGIPVFQPEKINEEEAYTQVLNYKPDIIITAAFGQILPKALLEAPELGCINVHASLLPELRGGAPIHYAIMQGKKETGITIMYMVEKLDAGDIISQDKITIEEDDHVGSLHEKLAKVGSNLLSKTLPNIFNKQITPLKQNEELATYASNIKREQEKIDWSKPSGDIYNQIRGLHPWPVAFTTLEGKTIKIWWAIPVNKSYQDAQYGEIVSKEEDGFIVCCGDQYGLKITDLQPAGKKRMDARDYLRGSGSGLQVGQKLGV